VNVAFELSPEALEALAARVAGLLAERDQPDHGFLDAQGAADYLACPLSRIYSLTSTGRLPVHRDGSRLLFDRAELRAYVEAGGAKRP
jgi:excisionase family DNA binding protein